jgi:hypothetical protein
MAPPLSPPSLPLTVLLVQATIMLVAAQIQAPNCKSYNWDVWSWVRVSFSEHKTIIDKMIVRFQEYNSLNQPPCKIAAYLAAECNNGRMSLS